MRLTAVHVTDNSMLYSRRYNFNTRVISHTYQQAISTSLSIVYYTRNLNADRDILATLCRICKSN